MYKRVSNIPDDVLASLTEAEFLWQKRNAVRERYAAMLQNQSLVA